MIKNPYFAKYYTNNREKQIERMKKINAEKRYMVIKYYSNNTFICKCCGESEYDFLTIDHIENNGNEHRKHMGKKYNLYQELCKTFPIGYQVYCMNCNHSKGRNNGVCVHSLQHHKS